MLKFQMCKLPVVSKHLASERVSSMGSLDASWFESYDLIEPLHVNSWVCSFTRRISVT